MFVLYIEYMLDRKLADEFIAFRCQHESTGAPHIASLMAFMSWPMEQRRFSGLNAFGNRRTTLSRG